MIVLQLSFLVVRCTYAGQAPKECQLRMYVYVMFTGSELAAVDVYTQ